MAWHPTRVNKGRILLFIVGVDAVMGAAHACLKLTESGPAAFHFTRRLNAEYFRQLSAGRVSSPASSGAARSAPGSPNGTASATRPSTPHAALHEFIIMGLGLSEEAETVMAAGRKRGAPEALAKSAPVIRSAWMGRNWRLTMRPLWPQWAFQQWGDE